jgi:hypothetical protein
MDLDDQKAVSPREPHILPQAAKNEYSTTGVLRAAAVLPAGAGPGRKTRRNKRLIIL